MEEIAGENAIQFMLMVYLEKKPLGGRSQAKFTRHYSEFAVPRQTRYLLAGAKPQSSPSVPGSRARSQTSPSLDTASANPSSPRSLHS